MNEADASRATLISIRYIVAADYDIDNRFQSVTSRGFLNWNWYQVRIWCNPLNISFHNSKFIWKMRASSQPTWLPPFCSFKTQLSSLFKIKNKQNIETTFWCAHVCFWLVRTLWVNENWKKITSQWHRFRYYSLEMMITSTEKSIHMINRMQPNQQTNKTERGVGRNKSDRYRTATPVTPATPR